MNPKRLVSKDILDKLDFDSIPTDIPLGFKPMGGFANPFDSKGDDESNYDEENQYYGILIIKYSTVVTFI